MLFSLATGRLRLTIDAAFGGRLVSLVDIATGRDWLVPDFASRPEPDSVYDARFARGWDECFPTVAPVDGRPFGWPGTLRDHGLLWGVPTETTITGNSLTTNWTGEQFFFVRTIVADGPDLVLHYTVTNRGSGAFGYLYSQHMLLATRPGDTIALSGANTLIDIDSGAIHAWPVAALASVQGVESGIMAKLYGDVSGDMTARIGDAAGGIEISWHHNDMPALGLWVDYGGWPVDGPPVHQIAIEPTTAKAHGLTEGQRFLGPGQSHSWTIKVHLD